jgi:hypothetical protein
MNFYLLLTVAFAFTVNSLPLPVGEILYRVPSKFFSKPSEAGKESTNSLYALLSQIHFGNGITTNEVQSEDFSDGKISATTTVAPEVIFLNVFPSNVVLIIAISFACVRFHKAVHEDVTEQQLQLDVIKVDDDNDKNSLYALIEKVVNEEIKKLAQENSPIGADEVIKLSSVPLLNVDNNSNSKTEEAETTTVQEAAAVTESFFDEQQQTEFSSTIDSDDTTETLTTTNVPAIENFTELEAISTNGEVETEPAKVSEEIQTAIITSTITSSESESDEIVTDESASGSISDSLLSAVGDLLSSILGLDSDELGKNHLNSKHEKLQTVNSNKDESKDSSSTSDAISQEEEIVPTTEMKAVTTTLMTPEGEASTEANEIEQGTERIDETETPVGYKGERNNEEESAETVPLESSTVELYETRDKDANEIDLKIENLAAAPTSFATEGIPETVTETVRVEPDVLEVIAEAPSDETKPVSFEESINQVMNLVKGTEQLPRVENIVDSILIDKHMQDDVRDLDEIVYETLKEIEANMGLGDDPKMPVDSLDPEVHQDLIKNFEKEIMESIGSRSQLADDAIYMPNSAKAALSYKQEGDADF